MLKHLKTGLIFFILQFIIVKAILADNVSISATVDRTTAQVGETIILNVEVKGAQGISPPRINIDGAEVRQGGTSQSFIMNNFQTSISINFRYFIIPLRAGKLTVPKITLQVGNNKYSTEEIELTITDAGSQQAPQKQSQPSQRSQDKQSSKQTTQKPTEQDFIFVRAFLSKNTAYVDEPIVFTIQLYYMVHIGGDIKYPEIKLPNSFVKEQLPVEQSKETTYQNKKYYLLELKNILIGMEPGNYTIEPVALHVPIVVKRKRVGDFFDRFFDDDFFGFTEVIDKVLVTPALKLKISQIPEEGKPPNFSGIIGNFNLTSKILGTVADDNTPIKYHLTFQGSGDLDSLVLKSEPDFGSYFRVFVDKVYKDVKKDGTGIHGKKTFSYLLIPKVKGKLEIPTLKIPIFNYSLNKYVTLTTQAFKISSNITPSVVSLKEIEHQKQLKEKGVEFKRDISFITDRWVERNLYLPIKFVKYPYFILNLAIPFYCFILYL